MLLNYKKILSLFVIFLLSLNIVFAQSEPEAGITPDSFLWGLDIAIEKIALTMTFTDEEKALLKLTFANERLSEMKSMIALNNDIGLEKANLNRERHLLEIENLQVSNLEGLKNAINKHTKNIEKFEKLGLDNEFILKYTKVTDQLEIKLNERIENRKENVRNGGV